MELVTLYTAINHDDPQEGLRAVNRLMRQLETPRRPPPENRPSNIIERNGQFFMEDGARLHRMEHVGDGIWRNVSDNPPPRPTRPGIRIEGQRSNETEAMFRARRTAENWKFALGLTTILFIACCITSVIMRTTYDVKGMSPLPVIGLVPFLIMLYLYNRKAKQYQNTILNEDIETQILGRPSTRPPNILPSLTSRPPQGVTPRRRIAMFTGYQGVGGEGEPTPPNVGSSVRPRHPYNNEPYDFDEEVFEGRGTTRVER